MLALCTVCLCRRIAREQDEKIAQGSITIEIVRLTSQSRDIPEVAILGGKRTGMATSCSVFVCHDRRIQGSNIRF